MARATSNHTPDDTPQGKASPQKGRGSKSRNARGNSQASGEQAAQLSYSEAHTALELALAQLQAPDLAVEEMGALYQRAQAYAARCEELLAHIEQSIELWDPQDGKVVPFESP